MNPDQRDLLSAILANPTEDSVRLGYADWLEEHDEPERAEFIRVQCALANHPGMSCGTMYCSERSPEGLCDECRRYKRLRRREKELFTWANIEKWMTYKYVLRHTTSDAEFERLHKDKISAMLFTRGFVSFVTCDAETFLAHADALVWNPEMTDACGHCVGRRPGSLDAHKISHPCRLCGGTGRIPRPCPATAQPLERAVLHDFNHMAVRINEFAMHHDSERHRAGFIKTNEWESYRWPGIVFELR